MWYDDKAKLSEDVMTALWKTTAADFCGEWNLFGVDIFNEPWAGVIVWSTHQKMGTPYT